MVDYLQGTLRSVCEGQQVLMGPAPRVAPHPAPAASYTVVRAQLYLRKRDSEKPGLDCCRNKKLNETNQK